MNNENPLDSEISHLVQNIEFNIPAGLDDRIRAEAGCIQSASFHGRRRFWLMALPPCAAVFLAAAVLLLPSRKPLIAPPDSSMFTEIRTDFEIPGKNIRIVFFQRPDFKFFEEK